MEGVNILSLFSATSFTINKTYKKNEFYKLIFFREKFH
jgi:hypothetical protein